jgi:membrane protease YdiL (CAAX protease family)
VDRTYDYRPVPFFVMAYVVTWIPWSVAAYVGSQNSESSESYVSLFNLVGLLGPLAVALFLILSSGSEALKSDFRDRLFNLRRIRPLYLIVAIVMPSTVMGLSIWLSLWFGQSADQFRLSPGANLSALIILAVILAPIIEEMGWRGYRVDSLRANSE